MTSGSDPTAIGTDERRCPSCDATLGRRTIKCARCGRRLPEAVEALRAEGEKRRRALGRKKAVADLAFLGGLLLGGPLLSFDIRPRAGLFLILGGGLASILRRYTDWSTPGTLLVGALSAAVVAATVMDPADPSGDVDSDPGPPAREAYVSRLGERWSGRGILAQVRGADASVAWFRLPSVEQGECGSFPPAEVREHLQDLGVRRVVIAARRRDRGLCSFAP